MGHFKKAAFNANNAMTTNLRPASGIKDSFEFTLPGLNHPPIDPRRAAHPFESLVIITLCATSMRANRSYHAIAHDCGYRSKP
jgi:hypothetical protein